MICVRLMGGLGNQLFQYAFGRALALRSGLSLGLSLSFLSDSRPRKGFTPRRYELDAFSIEAEVLDRDPGAVFRPGFLSRVERRLRPGREVKEGALGFDTSLLSARDGFLYEGNFQDERYFVEAREAILGELRPSRPLSPGALRLLAHIEDRESAALHVRRGDYASNPEVRRRFGSLGPEYYREAIGELRRRHPEARLVVFSDEPDWVRKNLSVDGEALFASDHDMEAWEELWLISRCRHAIVANSSFSWWGAWLNPQKGRTVIAPEPWFANLASHDVACADWTRVPGRHNITEGRP